MKHNARPMMGEVVQGKISEVKNLVFGDLQLDVSNASVDGRWKLISEVI